MRLDTTDSDGATVSLLAYRNEGPLGSGQNVRDLVDPAGTHTKSKLAPGDCGLADAGKAARMLAQNDLPSEISALDEISINFSPEPFLLKAVPQLYLHYPTLAGGTVSRGGPYKFNSAPKYITINKAHRFAIPNSPQILDATGNSPLLAGAPIAKGKAAKFLIRIDADPAYFELRSLGAVSSVLCRLPLLYAQGVKEIRTVVVPQDLLLTLRNPADATNNASTPVSATATWSARRAIMMNEIQTIIGVDLRTSVLMELRL